MVFIGQQLDQTAMTQALDKCLLTALSLNLSKEVGQTQLRAKYTPAASQIERIALAIVMAAPLILGIFHIPHLALLTVLLGVVGCICAPYHSTHGVGRQF